MCVPPWAKEGQTNWLDDSGCHSAPVQISVIVSLWGGPSCEQGLRGTAEGVGWKLLWSEHSRRCSCLYYRLYNLPGRALWRWERGQSAKWKRGSFFFRLLFSESLTHRQRHGRDDLTEQIARGLFRSRSRLWAVVFPSTLWTLEKRFCVTLHIIYNKVLSLVYWSPPYLLRHRRRP